MLVFTIFQLYSRIVWRLFYFCFSLIALLSLLIGDCCIFVFHLLLYFACCTNFLEHMGGVIILVFRVLYFVCFHPVSYVPNVARDSGLSILDCPFGFLKRLFILAIFIEVKPEKMNGVLDVIMWPDFRLNFGTVPRGFFFVGFLQFRKVDHLHIYDCKSII